MRTIVIKSTDQELIEAFENLAKILSQSFDIEEEQEKPEEESKENPEIKTDKFVPLSSYEELEKMLDDTIEERDKLERTNKFLQDKNNRLRELIAGFMIEVNKL